MLVMREKPGTRRRRAAAAAAYRANQEDLGPVVRPVADVLALLAVARGRRGKPTARED